MRCTVCYADSSHTSIEAAWSLTSARTPFSQLQLLFKLFEVTNIEFEPGAVCPECHKVIIDIDMLEEKLRKRASLMLNSDTASKLPRKSMPRSTYNKPGMQNLRSTEAGKTQRISTTMSTNATMGPASVLFKATDRVLTTEPSSDGATIVDNVDKDREALGDDEESDESTEADVPKRTRGSFNASQRERLVLSVNLSPGNLDHDVIHTKSNRDSDLIIYHNHMFNLGNRQSKYKKVLKWRCRNRSCRATLRTTWDCSSVLLDSVTSHNHVDSHETDVRRAMFSERLREVSDTNPLKQSEEPANSSLGFNANIISNFNTGHVQTLHQMPRGEQAPQKTSTDVQLQLSSDFEVESNRNNNVISF